MRATHDQEGIALFGGERIAPGYRGRRNSSQIAIKLIALALAVAFIGFATAVTAIAVRHANETERSISGGGNLAGGVSGSAGFEAALY
jgi:hypothetical protein